ncbi:bifunctional [glutamate--ammonia ligase]-adenylyl-L-tyrosine phosphorylase/[glutamate--ammonia-ligase] adenylyltransferase [Vibrio profundum]|uniref:bifunctional [glutamate--ammonia ligase]-adenylyl-L-tyrosine phosphorylase/[glutamate--ammonia-ligase] adenylyltransferase n=1 Tax=Vibrio profundum TaxID=2910247 RepID=UPI003D10C7E1
MQLPPDLLPTSEAVRNQLTEHSPQALVDWPEKLREQLGYVATLSHFVQQTLLRDSELLELLPQMLTEGSRVENYRERLKESLQLVTDEQQGYQLLRRFRNREMVYIAWRDFCQTWSPEQSMQHLSELAEALIVETYQWQYQLCCQSWGTPCNQDNVPQPMLIIGMGKLGGGELNFSSDIDLIFTYPENGSTQGARTSIDNAQFFTRLGQRIIKALAQPTVDGFCYRVDMRLRPFGESGPLVMSYSALEDYYQEQGRDWERYAMIKARVMGREMYPQYQELRQLLRPFVFRRYIDFSAIESLRRMKSMIRSEVRRCGWQHNIKLGAGGIREIEFIAQVFQLIRGGREPSLRLRGLLETLLSIESLALLDSTETKTLAQAYVFLRRLENLLQALDDKQTQTLPETHDEQVKLATAMGYRDWPTLIQQVSQHMLSVHQIFELLIGEEDEQQTSANEQFHELWNLSDNPVMVQQILTEDIGVSEPESLTKTIAEFNQDLAKKTLGPRGREVLNQLMPKLFSAVFDQPDAQFGLSRVLHLLNKIVTRTTYLELLDRHPAALAQLVHLCTASPMISQQLGRYPILLDELIDPQHLSNPMQVTSYKSELSDYLARIPADDMEQQMEALRQFKQICMLRIAAGDIAGALPIMKVSDHLTYLAEAIIGEVVQQAWAQLTEKYGEPSHLSARSGKGFAVVGYGKVGGWELGYNSDLDLVFMHDCPANVDTDGRKQIDGKQFYLRLAQRIVHIFSARTPSGTLYEVDTRLRPSGSAGLLVSSAEAFDDYQRDDAWTWEHQALIRARVVHGDDELTLSFNKTRHDILTQARDGDELKRQVTEMREKMYQHLASRKEGRFQLKQDSGGITDIEFLAQYLVLRFSHQHQKLTRWSDNVRIFESMVQQGVLSAEEADTIIQAYTRMRDQIHRRNLLNLDADVAMDKYTAERKSVQQAWHAWLG